jgi:crotonobetainyl-CoA:carnitine CoA-transferase CaiB-like acyl-CoA transferase
MDEGALNGIRVIELGQGVSAPFCARLFADYGADVKTSGFKPAIRPGPMIGRDNDRVFKDLLKITAEQYQQLLERQIIF